MMPCPKVYTILKMLLVSDEAEGDSRKKSGSVSDEERGVGSHRPHQCSVASCGKIFKLKAHLARHYAQAHGMVMRAGSPRPIMKTRTAFYLNTTPVTRLARRLCRHLLQARHAARSPFWSVNMPALKQECKCYIITASVCSTNHTEGLEINCTVLTNGICSTLFADRMRQRTVLCCLFLGSPCYRKLKNKQ